MARRSSKARKRPKARPQGILELTIRGFGFVKTSEGEFFIPASKVHGAFPGDLVEVSPLPSRDSDRHSSSKHPSSSNRKRVGSISKVLMRSHETILGRYEVAEPFGVVVPEDPTIHHDIFTLRKEAPWVRDGDVVEVELIEYPTRNSAATGRVLRVLGHEGDTSLDVDLIIANHKLETIFNEQALQEAEQCSLDIEASLLGGYEDLREKFVFTIDPFDARDYDDALSVEKTQKGYRLGVYIADVSRYVPFGSALDLDARRRATSVYLVDRVLPMLPEKISNNLCSLIPDASREVIAVEIELGNDGVVRDYRIFPAVICSKARLSYDQAQCLIDARNSADWYEDFLHRAVPMGAHKLPKKRVERLREILGDLTTLTQKLFNRRFDAGCMDFERVEARVQLNAEGTPYDVQYRRRTKATRAVEESMILANRLVAQWLFERELPCVYRVHDVPDGDMLAMLYHVLKEFDEFKTLDAYSFCSGNPKILQDVLSRAHTLPEGELIDLLLLRSMKRAMYRAEQSAHFGLAIEYYCHFTSPIRRYPDLLVHRLIKEALFGKTETSTAQRQSLPWMAEHSSKMERVAAKAEQESQMVKLVELMQADVGKEFEALVSGVSTFGVTLRLDNTAQGHMSIDELGDEYFSYDPMRFTLTGSDTGEIIRLGQKMRVVLVEAVPRERRLIFKKAR